MILIYYKVKVSLSNLSKSIIKKIIKKVQKIRKRKRKRQKKRRWEGSIKTSSR